jgi:hypothetical protein
MLKLVTSIYNAENVFDEKEGIVYFLPGYQGSTVDFRLRNP